jgi:hypothetical protein
MGGAGNRGFGPGATVPTGFSATEGAAGSIGFDVGAAAGIGFNGAIGRAGGTGFTGCIEMGFGKETPMSTLEFRLPIAIIGGATLTNCDFAASLFTGRNRSNEGTDWTNFPSTSTSFAAVSSPATKKNDDKVVKRFTF